MLLSNNYPPLAGYSCSSKSSFQVFSSNNLFSNSSRPFSFLVELFFFLTYLMVPQHTSNMPLTSPNERSSKTHCVCPNEPKRYSSTLLNAFRHSLIHFFKPNSRTRIDGPQNSFLFFEVMVVTSLDSSYLV